MTRVFEDCIKSKSRVDEMDVYYPFSTRCFVFSPRTDNVEQRWSMDGNVWNFDDKNGSKFEFFDNNVDQNVSIEDLSHAVFSNI